MLGARASVLATPGPIWAVWPGQGCLSLAPLPRLEGQGWTQAPFLLLVPSEPCLSMRRLLGCGTAPVSNNPINTGTPTGRCATGGESKAMAKAHRECLSGPTYPFPA